VPTKSDIIQRLEREILPLQGFKPPKSGDVTDFGLGPVHAAFSNGHFPTGAVHEVVSSTAEGAAASVGFIGGLVGALMRPGGAVLWIGAGGVLGGAGVSGGARVTNGGGMSGDGRMLGGGGVSMGGRRRVFPMALTNFGIEPDRVVFVELARQKDMLWVMEEALKCEGLAAVIGEIPEIGFTASRRLQLAVEKSRVTGFLLRHQSRSLGVNACVARWRVSPLASEPEAGLPGVGFPRWNVELLKIRNGRPGVWALEWAGGRFRAVEQSRGLRVGPAQDEAGPMRGVVAELDAGVPMVGAMVGELAMSGAVARLGTGLRSGATKLSEEKRKAG
jgi:protein ImuA